MKGRGRSRRRSRRRLRPLLLPPPPHDEDDLTLESIALARARRRRRRAAGHRGLLVAVALVSVAFVIVLTTGAVFTGRAVLNGNCSLQDLRPISLGENSFMFSTDGSLLGVIPSTKNRQPLKLGAISPWLPKATVAIEDRRFYQHGGLDYQGIIRAAFADLKAGKIVEGGSTITQELVRNLYIGSNQRTLSRKLKEACLAIKLSKIWSKKQILAAYVNEVFYGQHAYGAEAAAQTFFSTNAKKLTLPQAALLAGLAQAPSDYDPILHPDAAVDRRNEVLRAMLVSGVITPRQYSEAVASPLGLKPGKLYSEIRHPNFFGFAQQQLIDRFGSKRVEQGGLRVRTTIDPKLQAAARTALASVLREKTDPAAALVSIDTSTGAIKAMVNYLPSGQNLTFNLATQGHRQAGSAFKPFTLATAIDQGDSVYSTLSGPPQITIPDQRCYYNGQPWDVHNSADEAAGTMNLLDATANSVNTIYAQLVVDVGPENVAATAHEMGIESPLQAVCSITLGSQAVTPLEMTDAYATLAARGVHHAPQALALVRDPEGHVLGRLDSKGNSAIPQNTADLVTYALMGVVQHGTGTAAALNDRQVAGKTGTAENYQDAWFCGFVPQLATCVWVGYPHVEKPLVGIEGLSAVFGGTLPAEIWRNFMSVATAKLPVASFPYPTSFGTKYVQGTGYSTYPTTPYSSTTTTTQTTTQPQSSAPSQTRPKPTPQPPPAPPPPADTGTTPAAPPPQTTVPAPGQ